MGEREYAVRIVRVEIPLTLVGAPWERAQVRRVAQQVALPGRSRLGTAALSDALTAWAAAHPPPDAARALPVSRLRHPWARWWRGALLHAAHPAAFPPPTDGAYVELDLAHTAPADWLPSPIPTMTERRLAANALRMLLPAGSLAAEIARRQRPGWNQVIPQAVLWELAVSHIRRRSFKLRLMLPARHAAGLPAGSQHTVPLSLSLSA